ncbi:carbonyl reductase [NADPH] 1-like [Diadema antillarum]|uniref:carbonyl reductase [NADPH] 1-like n=1 Tax=Diadema antillarum TaxID=105358 RepID=UPI003A83F03D
MSQKVVLVTGSNTGIGLSIVRSLCKHFGENGIVYLTARNEGRGREAIDTLEKEGLHPRFHLLDVGKMASMEAMRDFIKAEHGGLDILINNAGIAYKGNDTPMSEQARGTIDINFYGVLHMTNLFLPLIRNGGRIVQVASMVAPMSYYRCNEDLQKKFKEVSTEQGVIDLMEEFVKATGTGNHVDQGWPDWAYGVSKLGVVALTRIQGQAVAKDTTKEDVLLNCCCPGYVMSNMTAHHKSAMAANRIPTDEGAVNPVYLALLPPGTKDLQGILISKKTVKDFWNNDIRPISF